MRTKPFLLLIGALRALSLNAASTEPEAKTPKKPVTDKYQGVKIGTALSERIKQFSDIYSFLFAQLGMTAKK